MISHFNLTGISGEFRFSSVDREEIKTFFVVIAKASGASAETPSRYRVLIPCVVGMRGAVMQGSIQLLEMSIGPLDLASAGCLKLEEEQK